MASMNLEILFSDGPDFPTTPELAVSRSPVKGCAVTRIARDSVGESFPSPERCIYITFV